MKIIAAFAVGLALAATLSAAPAQAQNARSFVSPTGSDAAACTLAAPCRTFAAAILVTNAGGEIDILGTAGYGSFTINKAISIVNPGGVEAGIAVGSGGTGIVINAGPTDTVSLRGLSLDGLGSGAYGIYFNSGGKLEIINSVIRHFTNSGIIVEPTALPAVKILVSNTFVLDNGNAGIYLTLHGQASLSATINNVTANHNNYGMYLDNALSSPGFLFFEITDSHADNNLVTGITLNSNGLGTNTWGTVRSTTASFNATYGIHVSGGGTVAQFSHCLAELDNGTALQIDYFAGAFSDGTNNFGLVGYAGGVSGGTLQSAPPQ